MSEYKPNFLLLIRGDYGNTYIEYDTVAGVQAGFRNKAAPSSVKSIAVVEIAALKEHWVNPNYHKELKNG